MVNSESRYSYFGLEFYATAVLVVISVVLFWNQFPECNIFLVFGCILGFCLASIFWGKPFRILEPLINVLVFFIFAWMVYAIVNSSFFYRDIILICALGLIFLEIVFSFGTLISPKFLSYSQAITIPIFICWPAVVKEYSFFSSNLIAAYIILLFLIFIFKFRSLFAAHERPKLALSVIAPAVIVLLSGALIAWLVAENISIERVSKGGFISDSDPESDVEKEGADSQYYDLQGKLQDEFMNLMPQLESAADRQALLMMISSMINDSSNVAEVKKASQGLVDFLRRLGAGLEKNKAEGTANLLKSYLKNKAVFRVARAKKDIMDSLRDNSFNIIEKAGILTRANSVEHAVSYEKVFRGKEELSLAIRRSLALSSVQQDLQNQAKSLAEWKAFELSVAGGGVGIDNSVNSSRNVQQDVFSKSQQDDKAFSEPREEGQESVFNNPEESQEFEYGNIKLISIIISPQDARITMYGNVPLKVKGYYDDYSEQDITSEVEWRIDDLAAVKIDQGIAYPLKVGVKTMVSAQHLGIVSPPLNIAIIFTKWQIFFIIFKITAGVLLGVIIIFVALYFATLERRSRLKLSMDSGPVEFMVNLYDNALSLLSIFGAGSKEVIPPLLYANMVEEKYFINDALFLRFTNVFLEAKYSSHQLQLSDAQVFLENYNAFLSMLISRQSRVGLFVKYCLALWKRKPLFV